jgi:WD40 repeat protein
MLACLALAAVAAAPPGLPVLRNHAILSGHSDRVAALAFSPDGKLLAAASRKPDTKTRRWSSEIKLWDVETGKARATWVGHTYEPAALGFSPDGKKLVSITRHSEAIQWDMQTGKPGTATEPTVHINWAREVVFSADGKRCGTCGDGTTLVWDSASGEELFRHERKIPGRGSILSHDLSLIAAPNHQDVDLWDVRTGKLVRSLLDHRGNVGALALSRDDRLLAAGCCRLMANSAYASEVWLWDMSLGRRKLVIPLGELLCWQVALSPAGDLLAVAGTLGLMGPGEVRLFEIPSGGELARSRLSFAPLTAGNLTFRPDGNMLAAVCRDRTVRLWAVRRTGSAGGAKRVPK